MKSFSKLTLPDLLDLFTVGEPTPGGGTAAGIGGALGVSLLSMVLRLPKAGAGAPEDLAQRALARATLGRLRDRLLTRAEEDSEAYGLVRSAYRLPKTTDAEQVTRREAIQTAMRAAIDVPLDMMRACREALREAVIAAACGIASARGDVAVGLELLVAALRGAGTCVDENVATVRDAGYVDAVMRERRQLEADADGDLKRIRSILGLS